MTTAIRLSELLQEFVGDMALKISAEDGMPKLAGIETGFADFDRLNSGLRKGSLTVIASRPAMGKTMLALNIASHVVQKSKLPVLMFSLQDSALQITWRLVNQVGKIEPHKLNSGSLNDFDKKALDTTIEKLKDAQFYVDDSPVRSVEEIESTSREFIAKHGELGLIIIDDLQSMEPINEEEDAAACYEKVMPSLKTLAGETYTPIILLSRLTSRLEGRKNKRPRISDLPNRVIGQYSDLLMFLYRDGYYNCNSKNRDNAELIIGRNRHGPIGAIPLGAKELYFGAFTNL